MPQPGCRDKRILFPDRWFAIKFPEPYRFAVVFLIYRLFSDVARAPHPAPMALPCWERGCRSRDVARSITNNQGTERIVRLSSPGGVV